MTTQTPNIGDGLSARAAADVAPPSPPDAPVNLLNFTRGELLAWTGEHGMPPRTAAALWQQIYGRAVTAGTANHGIDANASVKEGCGFTRVPPVSREAASQRALSATPAATFSAATLLATLPMGTRARLDGRCVASLPEILDEQCSTDGRTRKFLLRLADGARIETVLMHHAGRSTVCLSTQVGCAMGCVFCATGRLGFTRNLTTAEIIGQALVARTAAAADGRALRNAVFMGMGEPLANFDAVMRAVEILCDSGGFALRRERVSVSTVGVVPGILRLAAAPRPPALAVSLHAATQEARAALVPAARRWPLGTLLDACREYTRATRRKIFFEWTLIRGCNDSPATARALVALLRGLAAHVNLIPLNPPPPAAHKGTQDACPALPPPAPPCVATLDAIALAPPEDSAARNFQRILREAGIPATFRASHGPDILAACGQLSAH